MKLGWAAGKVLAKNGDGPVLIGKDTRISGYMFESALEAGLSAAGVDICLLGPMPTPGIAYLTRNARAQAGIVISASHNSFHCPLRARAASRVVLLALSLAFLACSFAASRIARASFNFARLCSRAVKFELTPGLLACKVARGTLSAPLSI